MTVQFSDLEKKRSDRFCSEHGDDVYYKIKYTGIGIAVYICCDKCGTEEDITDYSCW
jgi:hypothetical protein